MKVFLTLVLVLSRLLLCAQQLPAPALYTNARAGYQLTYPGGWQLRRPEESPEAIFSAGSTQGLPTAVVTLSSRLLPASQKALKLTATGGQDSVWRSIRRLPNAQVLSLDQHDAGSYDEVRYDYTYAASGDSVRTHVVGRRLWRYGTEVQLEYRAPVSQDVRYLAQGQRLVGSFAFTEKTLPGGRYAVQGCDDKLYGIAAMRYHNGQWEDDCRTIHEFPNGDFSAAPVIHRRALPFQSYALAKGFDNCLYSVSNAPTDTPQYVYRYDPVTRRGRYTTWRLPAQGPETGWIAGATDAEGYLYFLTGDAGRLVKVNPFDGTVTMLWASDPTQNAPYYRAIGFSGAGTHGNFCIDDTGTLYMVYSTDGSLLKVNLKTGLAAPDLLPLDGLPKRGGYSDVLMENDRHGQRRIYLAGPKAVYLMDVARHQAHVAHRGTYTDLAGCNLFRSEPRPLFPPLPPTTASWRGRVLNADTYQPLPQAQLRLRVGEAEKVVRLSQQGTFAASAIPGQFYTFHAQLDGYLAVDTAWTAAAGPHVQDILLRPLAVGTTQQLANVQFEQGRAVLLASSFPALDKLLGLMKENPRMTIELRGHTDNVGDPDKNVILSEQRAGAVKVYLVEHGIAQSRVTSIGFGGAQPAASNAQEMTRKINRRVEFRVTGMR
jgi:outer membrane protein OmpA-like peptidoglycan-associated protein